jgi:[pyruvate, water dikinase]-phosphate phosphotransferase / [pyruvate, water dikinase] kinase
MTSQYVLIVSDGTGETAYRLLKAGSRQFETDVLITRYAKVRDKHQIEEIVRAVRRSHTLIVYTFASRELRAHMEQIAQREKLDSIDVFGPIVDKLSGFFHRRPVSKPGLLHQVDAEYFDRVDAVEFAIRHDDGESLENLDEADIVLVGVSRTSKTPLSIFLAQEGWRVANIPIGVGSILPSRLFEIDQHKIVGLVVDPERLAEARRARLEQLGMEETSYADMEMINGEMDYARAVFEQNPAWPVIDVTGKSIEEISQEVLDVVIGRGRRLQ